MWERESLAKKLIVFSISIIILLGLLAVSSWANPIVVLADPQLEDLVRERLDRPQGPIYISDVLTISEIHAPDLEIEVLNGLEHFSKLTTLDLANNQISDLSPLSNLTQLVELNLRDNFVEDISTITSHESLRKFDLRGNRISDLSPLRTMRSLEYLNLRDNRIEDIQALGSLISLEYLNLRGNDIADLDVLARLVNLNFLNLSYNRNLENIDLLSKLINLQTLKLEGCSLSDISAVENMHNLEELNLRDNNIDEVTSLSGLVSVLRLNLRDNQISDLTPLSNLRVIIELDLRGNQITDVSTLTNLIQLQNLNLRDNDVGNIDEIINLTNLRNLNLKSNRKIMDIGVLVEMSNLVFLDLEDCSVSDVTALSDKDNLEYLNLRNNNIEHIDPLGSSTKMRELDLRGNKITDIKALTDMNDLEYLNLRDNNLSSIESLKNKTKLTYLNLHSNAGIESVAVLSDLINLEVLSVRDVYIGESINFIKNMTSLYQLNLRNTGISDTTYIASLMEQGALQDDPENETLAEVNLFENESLADPYNDPTAPLRPYWENITLRYPQKLPYAVSSINMPEFSHEGGFYQKGFWLEIAHEDPQATIYYTNDGSEPSNNSIAYKAPIYIDSREGDENYLSEIPTAKSWMEPNGEVFKGTVIRSIAIVDSETKSNILTRSFFVSPISSERYSLPVISMTIEESDFFDDEFGIYTTDNASNTGMKWERPAHIEFYETDKSFGFSQNVGVRIHGGATRTYRQKSLRLYARSMYDIKNVINYEIFPGNLSSGSNEPLNLYKTLVLRNAGNDWGSTLLRDGFMQGLVEHFDSFETQSYRPAILFINGEYWGIHGIRERYDVDYFVNHFSVEQNETSILTGNAVLKVGTVEDRADYINIRNYIDRNDMSVDEHYQHVLSHIDISSLIDYYTANIFFGNRDWPQGNIDYWRVRPEYVDHEVQYYDGRWRWLLFDTDFGFGRYGEGAGNTFDDFRELYGPTAGVEFNTLAWSTAPINYRHGSKWPNLILYNLLENENFKNKFINSMADQLNSSFRTERVFEMLNQYAYNIEPEISEHIKRWRTIGDSWDRWNENIQEMRDFAKNRPSHVLGHYMDYFELSGTAELTITSNLEQGSVKVNNLLIDPTTPGIKDAGDWRGIYFQGLPIRLEAIARPGYVFTGWQGLDSMEAVVEVVLEGDLYLKPVFQNK